MTKLVKGTKYSIYVLFILDNTLHGYGYYFTFCEKQGNRIFYF